MIIAADRLVSGEAPRRSGLASFDALGALLGTGGMLLLIYALVKAPDNGWGSAPTVGELAGAAVLLAALVINELRHPNRVLPLSIFWGHGPGRHRRGHGVVPAVSSIVTAGVPCLQAPAKAPAARTPTRRPTASGRALPAAPVPGQLATEAGYVAAGRPSRGVR